MSSFVKSYVKLMRPYLFFVTGIAGWLGILFANAPVDILRQVIVLGILFISWGLNQIVNDFLGIKEDRINAPHRPLVSGELNKKHVLLLTFIFFLLGAIVSFFLNPYALIIYFAAFIFNVVYEYFKSVPLLGNIWFGIMIGFATIYGALAVTNLTFLEVIKNLNVMYATLAVILISSSMCFFTYFKDYKGDKETNKRTLVVLLNPKKARHLNFIFSILPFLVFFVITYFKFWQISINLPFIILIFIAFIFCQYTAYLYFKNFKGENYGALKWNFKGAVLFQVSFMALVSPLLAIILFILAFVLINILFNYYKDP